MLLSVPEIRPRMDARDNETIPISLACFVAPMLFFIVRQDAEHKMKIQQPRNLNPLLRPAGADSKTLDSPQEQLCLSAPAAMQQRQ